MDNNDVSNSTLGEIGEAIQGAAYILAQHAGVQIVIRRLREKAGNAYVCGRDVEAHLLRELTKELEGVAESLRSVFDGTYKPRERAAFEELERRDALKATTLQEREGT